MNDLLSAVVTHVLRILRLEPETISVAGGIVLFLIALRMIFPSEGGLVAMERLMGLLLVMVAVQMLMNGLRAFRRP